MYRAGSVAPLRQLAGHSLINQEQSRGMATLKDISVRLKSVKNIQKITQSMKMVAAAKYAQAERGLKPARPYGEGAQKFYESCEVGEAEKKPHHLMVVMTSDRGLCGAVHSSIVKNIRSEMQNKPAEQECKLVIVGDKAKAMLQKQYGNDILVSINDIGKKPPTFADATVLANAIIDSGYDFNQGDIYYNRFKSVVSYKTSKMPIASRETVAASEKLSVYDSLDENILQSYMEYSMVSLLYYALKEGACSEQSARMTAMDAASKNAGEMIDKLTLHFNRTRQAVITRELIEIISGAAAL